MHLHIQEHLTFYIYYVYISGIKKKEYCVLTARNIHIAIFLFLNQAFLINGSQIVFISIFGQLNRSVLSNMCAASLRCLIFQSSSLSIILA